MSNYTVSKRNEKDTHNVITQTQSNSNFERNLISNISTEMQPVNLFRNTGIDLVDDITTLQRTIGNQAVDRLTHHISLDKNGTHARNHYFSLSSNTTSIQRQDASKHSHKTSLEKVKAVRSLDIDDDLAPGVQGAEHFLQKKIIERKQQIEASLKMTKNVKGSKKPNIKVTSLETDLKKNMDDILKLPDSRYVIKGLREQIIKASEALAKKEKELKRRTQLWHAYDKTFASQEVVKTLSTKGFLPEELKALLGNESGDLSKNPQTGTYVGIAQMDMDAIKEVGGKPDDRKDPVQSIKNAAQFLINKAKSVDNFPVKIINKNEYKKFVFASYNAGQGTIKNAQEEAKAMNRNPTVWDELIKGGDQSPLYKAIALQKAKYPTKKDILDKYDETTRYVEKIFRRLAP